MPYISNLETLKQEIITDENLLIQVLEDSGAVAKSKHKHNCPACGSSDNLNVFAQGQEYFYKCYSPSCYLGAGTVLQYIERTKGLDLIQSIEYLVKEYRPAMNITYDKQFQSMEQYLKQDYEELKYIRHHYYKNEQGEEIAVKKLLLKPDGKKTAIWFKVENNKAVVCGGDIEMPVTLYNADKIAKAKTIYFAEGEKDANTLTKLGFTCTCTQGSSMWKEEYTKQLEHADHFVIFADNDETGKKSAQMIVSELKKITGEYNTIKSIKVVDVPSEHEKDDITDYVERLIDAKNDRKSIIDSIMQLINSSENLLSVYEIHKGNYGLYKWIKDKVAADQPQTYTKVYITDFDINVIEHVHCIDDDELSYFTVEVTPAVGATFTKKFNNLSMINIDSFKKAIASNYCTFSGRQDDLDGIKKRIFNLKYPTKKVLTFGGMRLIEGQWVYVEKDRCLIDGHVCDEYSINPLIESIESDILSSGNITKEEIKELEEHIFSFNSPSIVYSILGYSISTFLKQHLRNNNIKFPHMFSVGEAGAGKSETLEFIIGSFFGLSRLNGANNITQYSLDMLLASNNIIPLIIDEYKPHRIAKWRVDLLSNMMRTSYDNIVSIRGNGRGTLNKLQARTNIILNGEVGTTETAVIERSIMITYSKRESRTEERSSSYEWLKQNKSLLTKLSKLMILNIINLTDEDVKELYTSSMQCIPDDVKESRVRNSLAISTMGLILLNKVFKTLNVEEAINIIAKNSIDEVGGNTKGVIELTLEEMSKAFSYIKAHNDDSYELCKKVNKGDGLALRINKIYPLLSKYTKDFNTQFELMPESDFTKLLGKSSYFKKYAPVKFNLDGNEENFPEGMTKVKQFKSYVLGVEELSKLEIDELMDC